ncbi:MAG: hypothetical protein WB952_01565 [Terriglobales bacterium]
MNISRYDSDNLLVILSRLLFSTISEEGRALLDLSPEQFQGMLSLANSNHVVVRSLEILRGIMADRNDCERCEWAIAALEHERLRIGRALSFLQEVRGTLASEGCDVIVIKSLDHWPDLGSDLDLYTNSHPAEVIRVMTHRVGARMAERSWGDRLADKWNFIVSGLPELVEIHMGRLGQTGELGGFASSLSPRARYLSVGDCFFPVPAATDRLMICTLQRMYRHFYIRLCDIADTAQLLETEFIDYEDLQDSAQENGIWEGVATFLAIVSDYVERWRGRAVDLPASVRSAARFGGDQISSAMGFLRVPILPHSVRLYASEWATLILQGQLRNTARLSLLPWLATAAALGQRITGSDKGIW